MKSLQENLINYNQDENRALIFNIERFSTEDGPGIRTTVFFKGCPLKCPWCHNPESIDRNPQLVWYSVRCIASMDCIKACQEDALNLTRDGMIIDRTRCTACGDCVEACPSNALEILGNYKEVDEIYREVLRDRPFYDKSGGGVTFGGGEPLLQFRPLIKLAEMFKKEGIHTTIDTTGFTSKKVLDEVLPHIDLVLLDLKQMDPELHIKYTGVPLKPILENAIYISQVHNKKIWIRTPVIPGFTDQDENIIEIAQFIKANLPTVERYDLLAFNNTCKDKYERLNMEFALKNTPLMSRHRMNQLLDLATKYGVKETYWTGTVRD